MFDHNLIISLMREKRRGNIKAGQRKQTQAEDMALGRLESEGTGGTSPAHTLISDF